MSARWFTLFIWAAVAASALFWALKLVVKAPQAPPQTQVAGSAVAAGTDLSRLLGVDAPVAVAAATPEPAADARFNLVGVLSPRAAQAVREGVALIAVDGKPARAFRVGALVDGQNVLQSVNARGAALGPRDGPALIALRIAPPNAAATGQLPSAYQPAPVPVPVPGSAVQRPGLPQPMPPMPPMPLQQPVQQPPPQLAPQPAPQPMPQPAAPPNLSQTQQPYSRDLSPLK